MCWWHVQLPAGAGASSQQYLLPTAATPNLHTPACYNSAAAAGFLAAGMTDVSTAAASAIASHSSNSPVSDLVILAISSSENKKKLRGMVELNLSCEKDSREYHSFTMAVTMCSGCFAVNYFHRV